VVRLDHFDLEGAVQTPVFVAAAGTIHSFQMAMAQLTSVQHAKHTTSAMTLAELASNSATFNYAET
jgi:hypothetical protein